mgnify:CR=1 FL=1
MLKQTSEARQQETRKITIISGNIREEIEAVVLGSMGCAPKREGPYRKRTDPILFATTSAAKVWMG